MQPPPLKEKPLRPMPFDDLPGLTQKEAVYVWGISAALFGVLMLLLVGIPLVMFLLWPWYVRIGWPIALTTLTLLAFFLVGYFIGSWTGTLLVLDFGEHRVMKRTRR